MTCFWRIIALTSALAAGCASVFGQTEQPVVWVVECNDATTYRGDVTDSTKLARDPGATTALPVRAFQVTYNVADIVLINGKPAKGLMSTMNGALAPRVSPQPGLSIGDFDGGGPFMAHFTILAPDGTPVGAVWAGGGVLAPDMVSTIWAGSGAFLGMAGETRSLEVMTPYRAASVTEDPANRRLHGGGRVRFMWSLYPKYRPSVDVTPAGPSVFHGDLQPVTAARPARAGEVLIVRARNLGPLVPIFCRRAAGRSKPILLSRSTHRLR